MRSMWQILCAVIDGEITTKEQAEALLAEETAAAAHALKIPEADARAQLLANIRDVQRLCVTSQREKIKELFGVGDPPQ